MASSPASPLSIPRNRSFRNMGVPSPRTPPPAPAASASCDSPASIHVTRTPSGRFLSSLSHDENDIGGEVTSEFVSFSYTVQIPPTPDHQPMSATPNVPINPMIAAKAEQQYVSSTLFSGGFNSVTRGHVMDKMIESESSDHPQMACGRKSDCAMKGCDGKVVRDERGEDLAPCECGFKICSDCYFDALNGQGNCPGCKEGYRTADQDADEGRFCANGNTDSKMERRLSLLKSVKSNNPPLLMSNQMSDFDHARWLYETKGTYGYGNAVWPKDVNKTGVNGDVPPTFTERTRRPLSRKKSISAAILSPYRILVFIRIVALGLFLTWRIRHPNTDAMWLWGMSVICEIWFAFTWMLDQLPKLVPVNRTTDLKVLKEKFERVGPENPRGRSDLPGIDVFVSTADPEKEPPLVTANTILSILAADYPVDKLACYLSDDGGSLLNFEALAEAASFGRIWVPFCRKHNIEPRNPESYFQSKGDPTKNKVRTDFVRERRRLKREYDEFKVRINMLPESIRRRSDAYNAHEEIRAKRAQMEQGGDGVGAEALKVPKATWMADGTHWPGTWTSSGMDHGRGDHAGIIQVMLAPPSSEMLLGSAEEDSMIDATGIDIRLPMLVYVSREKRPGYDHNKKAGAMNSLVRTSAIMSNGAFILNLDCDHYIYNSLAMREAMCFMMDKGGDRVAYVQFPQRFEGIDPNDRYANHNTVFFDVNMRALDGIQGPMYVGTGCVFRRVALYGFLPPERERKGRGCCCLGRKQRRIEEEDVEMQLLPKRFGSSVGFVASIAAAENAARPLIETAGDRRGRAPGILTAPREPMDAGTVAEAINVISCYYEDKTEWGNSVGWIYGSVTEDVVTGYRMHDKGWRSVYCVTRRDAFRGTAPINLTDRLHQVLRWATGSVEIFFSRNNALFASSELKLLQRIAYINVGIYPFTSLFLTVYCFLPALSLFTGHFIVQQLSVSFLVFLLVMTATLAGLAVLEVRWSGITLEEWWRNEQFWLIGGTSAHMAAVVQGLLKIIAGIDVSFTLTSKGAGDESDDVYGELYAVRWTALMIPPVTIMLTNLIAVAVGVARAVYSTSPQWSKLLGGTFFSFWVLAHLYPFAKGLMGRRGRTPTIVFVWSGLLAIIISLLWVSVSPPAGSTNLPNNATFQFP